MIGQPRTTAYVTWRYCLGPVVPGVEQVLSANANFTDFTALTTAESVIIA